MRSSLILVLLFAFINDANAEDWKSKNTFGLGVTNNANLSKDEKVSDTFMKLTSSNTTKRDSHFFGVRLGYTDYIKEHENDAFSFRLSDTVTKANNWKYGGALLGQIYTANSPGTTDESFTNIGGDLGIGRDVDLRKDLLAEFGTGYRLRYYPSFSGRNDHAGFINGSLDFDATKKLTVGGLAEMGVLFSSLPDYSRTYVDLGVSIDYELPARWDLLADLAVSQSYFTSRTLSTSTTVTQRRGNRTTSS